LKRLELLELGLNTFEDVFQTLCDASPVLKELRSLGLAIPGDGEGWVLKRLSTHFPGLVHLTLKECFNSRMGLWSEQILDDAGTATESRTHDGLKMPRLEVLFLFARRASFQLSIYSLPALLHFHFSSVVSIWNVFPFLERHPATIETIDLDDRHDATLFANPALCRTYDARSVDFWGIFPRLTLLRCNLAQGTFDTYPGNQHALECLAHTGAVNN